MTKEVAEKIVRGITDKIECNTVDIDDWAKFWGFTREEYEEFLDMSIKGIRARVKRDVLKKIVAEIEDTGAYEQEVNGKTEFLEGITYCLNIINKYKAESEDEE